MPVTANYPFFCLVAGFFMMLGGLASRNPSTAVMAASYGTFFPFLLGMDNQDALTNSAGSTPPSPSCWALVPVW